MSMHLNIRASYERSATLAEKIFIDTNPLIYLIGGQEPFYSKVLYFMKDCILKDAEFYTSTITDAEFLVKPFADKNSEDVEKYKLFLKKLGFLKCFISEQIAEKAALIRANYPYIKLADALQLASSIDCGCDVFLTNDKQLKQISEAHVLYLSDL